MMIFAEPMKLIKRILALALASFCAVLLIITLILLLVTDDTLVSQIVKQLESASEIRVVSHGDAKVARSFKPTLTVDDLVVTNSLNQYRFETTSLKVQVNLLKLFIASLDIPYVAIGDTQIEIKEGVASGKKMAARESKADSKRSPPPLKPVLHHFSISQLKILHEGVAFVIPETQFSDFSMAPNPDNDMVISLQVALFDQTADVNAVLKDVDHYFGGQPLGFALGARNTTCHLFLEGHIDFDQPQSTIDAAARVWTPDGVKIVTGEKRIVVPGKFAGEGQLKGTFTRLAMEKIIAAWHGPNQSRVEITGGVVNVFELDGVQLNLTGTLQNPEWLTPLLPESVGPLKSSAILAQISGSYPKFSFKDLRFESETAAALDFSLSGKFDLAHSSKGLEPENIQAELAFAAPATRAARVLFWEKIPEFGAIKGECRIRSTTGDPILENISVQTKDANGIKTKLFGKIATFPLADRPNSGYDLDVSIKATKTAVMAERVGMDLPLRGPMDMDFRIEGSTQSLALNKIVFSAGEGGALRIGVQGALSFGDWDRADPYKTIDLRLHADASATAAIGKLIGQELPEFGALSAKATFHTVSGVHRIDELVIQTGKNAPLAAAVSGTAKGVILLPTLRVEGILLDAKTSTDDTAKLNKVFGLNDKIPPIGSFQAQARISGNEESLTIEDCTMVAGNKDILQVTLSGRLGELSASNQWQLMETRLAMEARSNSSRVLAQKMGHPIPELGPLFIQADLRGKDKMLGMDSARLLLGDRDMPVLKATGHIHDVRKMKGVKCEAQLFLEGQRVAAFTDLPKLSEMDALTGKLSISDDDGTLGLDQLQAETGQTELLSLTFDGSFGNFKDPSTLSVNSSLTAHDLALIGAIFDRQWPVLGPVKLDTEIKRTGNGNDLNCTFVAGETEIEAKINARLQTAPWQIDGSVTARNLLAWDVFERVGDGKKKKPPRKRPVFGREPMAGDWMKQIDMDIAIDVESFSKEMVLADSVRLQLKLKSGLLSVSPFRFVYPKGMLDMDLQFDGRDRPHLTFRAHGERLDPWKALNIQESRQSIGAEMNIDMFLDAWGTTPHQLASNCQGSIYITAQNGKLRAALSDLVFLDIVGWALRTKTGQKFYDIDCAVADYTVEQGVVSTNAFIIENKDIVITGSGTIDLGKEEIEYVLLPKKRSQFFSRADPVKINGSLMDPSVKALPWKSAATQFATVGGMVFAPYIFFPLAAADHLAGSIKNGQGASPCLQYQKTHAVEMKGPAP